MRKPTLPLIFILTLVLFFGFGACLALNSAIIKKKKKIQVRELGLDKYVKEGDIIFQSTQSRQCEAVKLVTKSRYSHVGMVLKKDSKWMVLEAVQPVRYTALQDWITHGEENHFVLKRVLKRDSLFGDSLVNKLKTEAVQYLNKNYDIYFGWSNESIYCSELVWKMYHAIGINVGKLEKMKDFDLSSPIVQEIVKERYGNKIPLNETVISPAAIFNSNNLQLVLNR